MAGKAQSERTNRSGEEEGGWKGDNVEARKTVVILATDHLGKGNDDLGRSIVTNFIKTMPEMKENLWRLVLLNGGVKLAVDGAEALPHLRKMAEDGLDILVCGHCLETFGLLDRKRIGEVTNMVDIVTSLQVADKVISFT